MELTKDVTIIIPLRIDSQEREDNLNAVIRFFINETDVRIIILEADDTPKFIKNENERIEYCFYTDNKELFHRTHYINMLLKKAKTPIVGVWDTDVLFPISQIEEACMQIKKGASLSFPYDGNFIYLHEDFSKEIREDFNQIEKYKSIRGVHSVGGAFFVDREKYLKCGGENENFYAWGPEDIERVKRLEILGMTVARTEGNLYHQSHPRGINSECDTLKRDIDNLNILIDICKMNQAELVQHIEKWSWNK